MIKDRENERKIITKSQTFKNFSTVFWRKPIREGKLIFLYHTAKIDHDFIGEGGYTNAVNAALALQKTPPNDMQRHNGTWGLGKSWRAVYSHTRVRIQIFAKEDIFNFQMQDQDIKKSDEEKYFEDNKGNTDSDDYKKWREKNIYLRRHETKDVFLRCRLNICVQEVRL